MSEEKELYNDVCLYIQNIYKNINEILVVTYSQQNINVLNLQNLYTDMKNIIDYVTIIGQATGLEFDTESLNLYLQNYLTANKTSNYLLLADTLEYEFIPSISNYYDTIIDNLLD